jgi:uncharacterized protein with von Willebrand factor type A (vWA) domain
VSQAPQLPRAARAFVSFVTLLRANGFAIAPEQTVAFLQAITLLGPRGTEDIRQAGLATLAPPPERRAAYDMLFRIHFLGGQEILDEGEDEEVVRLQEEGRGDEEPLLADETNKSGERRCVPKHSQSAASVRAGQATRCAVSRAKRPGACRAGAAIDACARGAGPGRICGEPCAKPRVTTAR